MNQERNLGVTEARFGLTIVICLLAAVGFFVLLRVGNTGEPTAVEFRNLQAQPELQPAPQVADNNQVQVLPVEPEPRIARRTELLQATYSDGAPTSTGNLESNAAAPDIRR